MKSPLDSTFFCSPPQKFTFSYKTSFPFERDKYCAEHTFTYLLCLKSAITTATMAIYYSNDNAGTGVKYVLTEGRIMFSRRCNLSQKYL